MFIPVTWTLLSSCHQFLLRMANQNVLMLGYLIPILNKGTGVTNTTVRMVPRIKVKTERNWIRFEIKKWFEEHLEEIQNKVTPYLPNDKDQVYNENYLKRKLWKPDYSVFVTATKKVEVVNIQQLLRF